VMDRIEAVGRTLGTGSKTRLQVSGNATWPLSWYLRHYPVNWGADVRNVDTPVVIIDKEATNALDTALAEKYEKVPFQIRGWWEPDWNKLNATSLVKYLLTREAFSGVGSSDAVMYVLKDLSPGKTIASVAVNPPPAARGYPRAPLRLVPSAVWGQKGTSAGEFNEPRGLAVDATGNLYIVDSKNNRVQKLAPDGKPLLAWGQEGKEPGQFKDPGGIAIGPDGSVYVADTWNHRVQKFDSNGKFLAEWRPEPGFWGPRGIAINADGSMLYVTDTGNKRVVAFDAKGKQLAAWGRDGSKPGDFIEPVGVAVDQDGHVLVADTGNRRIQVFDAQGKFLKEYPVFGWEEFYTEPYLAPSGSFLLVTDSYNHRAARYTDGTLVDSWGKSGAGPGDFNRPIGVVADAQGNVYVSDTMNNRIQKFTLPPAAKDAEK
jgi:DNA-binding beta-propeller fold protein YncE